jgi:hypothetical protein
MPLNELSSGILYWGNQIEAKYETKVLANCIILISILFFCFGKFLKVNFIQIVALKFPVFLRFQSSTYFLILILYLGLYLYFNNFEILFFRKNIFENKQYTSIMSFIFYQNIILSLIFILLIISYNHMKEYPTSTRLLKISKIKTIFFIVFLTAIITANPLSLSRFQVAVYYLPILFYLKIFNKPSFFFFFIILSILFLMPFLDFFRYFDLKNLQNFNWFDLNYLKNGHYDGYQNLTMILESNINLKGQNIISSIFWFIPRSIFEDKNLSSPLIISNFLNLNFTNITVSFIGEGYLAFGLFGVIIFALFIGILLGNLDTVGWKFISEKSKTTFLYYYYFLFGQIFILLRGDLVSGFSFIMCFAFIFTIVLLVFKK